MSSALVDLVGMAAGAVWMSAAFHFQMVRRDTVEPGYVAAMFLIGLSLMLSASALAIMDTQLAATLAVIGQVIMLLLGIAAWWGIDRAATLRAHQDPDNYDEQSRA